MKAISVFPGKPNSVHLAELPKPSLDQIPNGRGVLVKVLRIGVDGTDKEINAQAEAEYPGWLTKLLTDPVKGLENYSELFQKHTTPNGAIKVYCEVA